MLGNASVVVSLDNSKPLFSLSSSVVARRVIVAVFPDDSKSILPVSSSVDARRVVVDVV